MSLLGMVLPWWVRWAVLAALATAIYATGDIRGRSAVHAAWDKDKLAQAEADNAALQAAAVRGNELTSKLQQKQSAVDKLTQEKRNEIYRLTTGNRCLDTSAIGLLNRSADGVPTPAAGAAAENAAGAPASDRDVADWIIEARQQYETCSAKLSNLIDFVNP